MNVTHIVAAVALLFITSVAGQRTSPAAKSKDVSLAPQTVLKATEDMYVAAKSLEGALKSGFADRRQFSDLLLKLATAVELSRETATPAIVAQYQKVVDSCGLVVKLWGDGSPLVEDCGLKLSLANDLRLGRVSADAIPRIEEVSRLKGLALAIPTVITTDMADAARHALSAAVAQSSLPPPDLAPFSAVLEHCEGRTRNTRACKIALAQVNEMRVR